MPTTSIHLLDGSILVEPQYPDSLLKELTYWHRSLEQSRETYARNVVGHLEKLYTTSVKIDNNNKVINSISTMPGFAARIAHHLSSINWDFEFVDERTKIPSYNIARALEGLRDYQKEAAAVAISSGGGIISCPTGWGKGILIKSIIDAFDKNELIFRNTPLSVVVAADKDVCQKAYNDLSSLFYKKREVGLVMSGKKLYSDDIQVITFDSLKHINPNDIGIIIVDECHTSSTDKRIEAVLSAKKALKWGLSATPFGRFDGADLVTEGLFGPIVYKSTYDEGVKVGALVPIEVCWLACPEPNIGVESYLKYKTRMGKYNRGVELNNNLTKLIANIMLNIPDSYQTLCIMPHLQQMNEIYGLLTNKVCFVHAQESNDELISNKYYNLTGINKKEREEIYTRMESGEIRKILSTHVYKQGVNFPQLAIVICPGGGGSALVAGQIPGRASRAGVPGKDKSYIVEFTHVWDIQDKDGKASYGPLTKDDKSRYKVYKSLGFTQHEYNSIDDLPFLKNK